MNCSFMKPRQKSWFYLAEIILFFLYLTCIPCKIISAFSYDPAATYNYTQKYWDKVCGDGYFWEKSYPPTYFGSATALPEHLKNSGYDCAHFVSCSIGSESYERGGGLNIPSRTETYGEPGAARLENWLIDSSEIGEIKFSINELERGDVINYDWYGDGTWDHAAVYLGNNKVSAHSKSVKNDDWKLGGAVNYRYIHIIRQISDITGPLTSNLTASPNPTNGETMIIITATVSDLSTGNSNISAAEIFVDNIGANGYGFSMIASDGNFNSSTEQVKFYLPINSWTPGTTRTVHVHGKDSAKNWGACQSKIVTVTSPSDTTSPTVTITSPTSNPTYVTNISPITIGGTATDSGGSGLDYVLVINATNQTGFRDDNPSGNSSSFSISGITLVEGQNDIVARAYDLSGNPSSFSSVNVIYTPPDITPPTVIIFSADKISIILGETITFSYTVSDGGGSGLKQIELWRTSDTTNWGNAYLQKTSISGNTYSNTFYDTPQSIGIYWYGIHVLDNASPISNIGYEPKSPGPIKVIVTNSTTLSYIEIAGPTQVNENSGDQYVCMAYYSNGSSSNVTNSATWSDNSSYASINQSGYLTTYSVTSDASCTITANYGGKSDTHNITIKNIVSEIDPPNITSPTVTIINPTSEPTYYTDNPSVNISGIVSGNAQIMRVTWVNGEKDNGVCNGTANWNVDGITLYEGVNVITIFAWDASTPISAATLRIIYAPDTTTPPAPINLTVTPNTWTNNNLFTINWTNPYDTSGISKMWYKRGTTPSYSSDGIWFALPPQSEPFHVTTATSENGQPIYVWLEDVAGNKSHNNRASAMLYFDSTAPITTASPSGRTYNTTQIVTLTANETATIYYTKDDSIPTKISSIYLAPINISTNTTLKFFAADLAGNQESAKTETYTIVQIRTENQPPILNPIGNKTIDEGKTLEFAITAADPNGDNLFFTVGNMPTGAEFDTLTQTFKWATDYGQTGNYPNILFTVTDNGTPPASDFEFITITVGDVNRPPTLEHIGNKIVNEGEVLQFAITGQDEDGDELNYTANNLPPCAVFYSTAQIFVWSPNYNQAGNYENISFTVTDNGMPPESDSEAITITVGDVNRPPALNPIGNKTVKRMEELVFTIIGSDPDGDNLTYSALNLPEGAVFLDQKFSWLLGFDQIGIYPNIRFEVNDGTDMDFEEITITVIKGKPRPKGIKVNAGNAQVKLSWEFENNYEARGYNLYRHEGGDNFNKTNAEIIPDTVYIDTSVYNRKKYYYCVTAVDYADEESDYSYEIEAIPQYPEIAPISDCDINKENKLRIIDGRDINTLFINFGGEPDNSKWNPAADINKDGIVDGIDLTLLGGNFGAMY